MPKVHMCEEPRCHQVIPFNLRWCKEHAKLHQRFSNISKAKRREMYKKYNKYKRDPVANAFYQSKAWKAVRQSVVVRDYHSSGVTGKVIPNNELIVDHIVPRRLCSDPYDKSNLWCLERGIHTIKTRIEERIASQPNGDQKLRHLSKKWWQKVLKEKIKNKNSKIYF